MQVSTTVGLCSVHFNPALLQSWSLWPCSWHPCTVAASEHRHLPALPSCTWGTHRARPQHQAGLKDCGHPSVPLPHQAIWCYSTALEYICVRLFITTAELLLILHGSKLLSPSVCVRPLLFMYICIYVCITYIISIYSKIFTKMPIFLTLPSTWQPFCFYY